MWHLVLGPIIRARRAVILWYHAANTLFVSRWYKFLTGTSFGAGTLIIGRPIVRGNNIRLGRHNTLDSSRFNNPLGSSRRCILRTYPGGLISIGDHFGGTGVTIVAVKEIVIGDHVTAGAECLIVDTDFHAVDYRIRSGGGSPSRESAHPVYIGNHVFIGARSIILKGVSIGDRCVVAAGAVVSRSVPPDSLVAGNPARVVKTYVWDEHE